ncbi:hypothetical protein [Snodgrassella alvi]|uniref:hypothetical protein n=1 Tax=Snodgrassella alvi TaxID=1196083 RepID=UPI000C1EF87E|nr:hypothetical protein [Snodgrassella alvi]PIT14355.1 hypothetical protein BGI33_07540 [Snodgrassella alvi]PIT17257.1 hypothetical protein BGI34_07655 [Snodgrassella alvi]
MLLKDNESIVLTGKEAIEIIKTINYFVISLNQIGHYYEEKINTKDGECDFKKEIAHFIIKNRIANQLLVARGILLHKFNRELGDDDMDDIERAIEKTKYWEKPGD